MSASAAAAAPAFPAHVSHNASSATVAAYSSLLGTEAFKHESHLRSIDELIAKHADHPKQQTYLRTAKRRLEENATVSEEINRGLVEAFAKRMGEKEKEWSDAVHQTFVKRLKWSGRPDSPEFKTAEAERFFKERTEVEKDRLYKHLSRPSFTTTVAPPGLVSDADPPGAVPNMLTIPFNKMKKLVIPDYKEYTDAEYAVIGSFLKTAIARSEAYRMCGYKPRGTTSNALDAEFAIASGLDLEPADADSGEE